MDYSSKITHQKMTLIFFSKLTYSKNSFRMSDSFDPDQDQCLVGPDLGPNCLQKLSVTTSRERDKRSTIGGVGDVYPVASREQLRLDLV